jgi:PKD repeat protein
VAVAGKVVALSLGPQQLRATTGATGIATVVVPILVPPGVAEVRASYAGSPEYLGTSAVATVQVVKQDTQLRFHRDPGVAQYSDDAITPVTLRDNDESTLREVPVLFVVSGGASTYAATEVTDMVGQAAASRVPLPKGSYPIEAHFGDAVLVDGNVVDLGEVNYGPSVANGTLQVLPEDASATYSGDLLVPEGSTSLDLAAFVTQADDGALGDISLAWVHFEVVDESGDWVAGVQAPVNGDGACTVTLDGLTPGTYEVGVTVVGGYFASGPDPRVAALGLPLEPVQIGSSVAGTAFFTDPDGSPEHAATWDWGDGTWCTTPDATCSLNEPTELMPGEVAGSHVYAEPGVYTVVLTVTDGDGYTAEEVYEFVVVYDLEGGTGFVTGGGWIWSQAGWCLLDSPCNVAEGKANFGFVSRYRKGASKPTGATEFKFSAGGLNFHSDSYEWLVVNRAGTNGQFKGTGTVNGDPAPDGELYTFMVWAVDGNPDHDDTFRIKIWWEDAGVERVVYDNGFGQAIGGGSIVIHKTK